LENPKKEIPKEAKEEDPTSEVKVEDPTKPLSLFGSSQPQSRSCLLSLGDVVPSEMLEAEQARVEKVAENPEDPGSEVDWGDESVKGEKEEPSSEEDGRSLSFLPQTPDLRPCQAIRRQARSILFRISRRRSSSLQPFGLTGLQLSKCA